MVAMTIKTIGAEEAEAVVDVSTMRIVDAADDHFAVGRELHATMMLDALPLLLEEHPGAQLIR